MISKFQSSETLIAFFRKHYPIAPYFDQIFSHSPDLRSHLDIIKLARLNLRAGSKVLDLGSGGLDKVLPLAFLGFKCTAFDDFNDPWHRSSLALISGMASEHDIALVAGSLRDLPGDWNLGEFDMIMLNDVIEHLPFSPLLLIQECFENLSKGGFLLINVPSCVNIKKRIKCLLGRSIYPPASQFFLASGDFRGHIREYSRHDLSFIASHVPFASSFEIKSVSHMIGVVPAPLRPLWRLMCFVFPSFSDSWQLILHK